MKIPVINELRGMGRKPRLHPNGFIQLDLNDEGSKRLHVWTPSPLQAQKTRHPIHDHAFDMESEVFTGILMNVTYQFQPLSVLPSDEPRYILHQAVQIGNNETILKPVPNVETGTLLKCSSRAVYEGETYGLSRRVLHDSIPAAGMYTVTVIAKANSAPLAPYVAVPQGIAPDNGFRRATAYHELDLWAEIWAALAQVGRSTQRMLGTKVL